MVILTFTNSPSASLLNLFFFKGSMKWLLGHQFDMKLKPCSDQLQHYIRFLVHFNDTNEPQSSAKKKQKKILAHLDVIQQHIY